MRNKLAMFLVPVVLGTFFACAGICNANTIFTDNFESYNLGKLSGQGGWLSYDGNSIQVQDAYVKEGSKALKLSACVGCPLETNVQKTGALLNDGEITLYFSLTDTTWQMLTVFLQEGPNKAIEVRFKDFAQYHNGSDYVNFLRPPNYINAGPWHSIRIQWRSSDRTARYQVNDWGWTNWAPTKFAWSAGIDTVRIRNWDKVAYIDAIREKPIVKHPVLIVPGIMGTEMKKDEELLWADGVRMVNPLNDDSFMDPLAFDENLTPSNLDAFYSSVIKKIEMPLGLVDFDYTEGLINEFKGQGYVEGESLFTFPYDWRYGVSGQYADGRTNSDLLGEKIQEVLNQTGASEVDIVAHSMGGLILKKYVADKLAEEEENKISKAVFVGTPNTGAPKAVKVLLQGDNFGVLGLNDQEMKKIAQNLPASYDLLPSQKYYDIKGSFIRTIEEASQTENIVKDLNFEETKSFLTADHGLNSAGLAGSEILHQQNFDDFDLRTAGVDLYNIAGCNAGTIGKITQRTAHAFLGDFTYYSNSKFAPGDGTVPLESATNLPVDLANKFYSLSGSHSKMMSQNGTRQKIVNLISGSNLAVPENLITQDISQCQLNGKAISVFSPINIFVTDQAGNKLGLAEDNSLINEIPNAGFEIWGQEKFIYLPNGQNYTVGFAGAGEGSYTIKVDSINNGAVESAEVFSNLTATPQLLGQINLSEAGTTLVVNSQTIAPNAVLSAEEAQNFTPPVDTTPPEAVIEFDPVLKDLKFSSSEPGAAIQDNGSKIILTDAAGNATEITLKEKNRKTLMRAEIASIKYNGVFADISKNSLRFSWHYNRKKNLETLTQRAISQKDYNILAVYNGKTTKITGRDFPEKISKSFSGLKILKITTNKGDFEWSY